MLIEVCVRGVRLILSFSSLFKENPASIRSAAFQLQRFCLHFFYTWMDKFIKATMQFFIMHSKGHFLVKTRSLYVVQFLRYKQNQVAHQPQDHTQAKYNNSALKESGYYCHNVIYLYSSKIIQIQTHFFTGVKVRLKLIVYIEQIIIDNK